MDDKDQLRENMKQAVRDLDSPVITPRQPKKPAKKQLIIIGVILGIAIVGLFAVWYFFVRTKPAPPKNEEPQATIQPKQEAQPAQKQQAQFEKAAIQKALKDWEANAGGIYSVTITDDSGAILAEANSDKQYFTASIYKIYVAYVGYQKIDDGTYKLSEPYLGGWTRGKCLDEMIRSSHSPCAEKMWVELGKENITQKLKTYGIENTSMTGLVTTSGDAAIILSRIQQQKDLSNASTKALKSSMLGQIYRDALPVGFKTSKVYDKVGFRGNDEYHDTAIVQLKDGRTVIVSVLTSGVGTKKIATLASQLEEAF